jgi:hypothetical protein
MALLLAWRPGLFGGAHLLGTRSVWWRIATNKQQRNHHQHHWPWASSSSDCIAVSCQLLPRWRCGWAVARGPPLCPGTVALATGFERLRLRQRPHSVPRREALPNLPGCSLGPSPFASAIKYHQKSTCNSAGSSVGYLAPPRATPQLGRPGAAVSCQYFPCSFVLASRARLPSGPPVGGQPPPPAPR